MTPEEFAAALGRLALIYTPKRDLPDSYHDLFDQTWWEAVRDLDGALFLGAVQQWIARERFMPKPAELRAAVHELADARRRAQQRALVAPPPPAPISRERFEQLFGPLTERFAARVAAPRSSVERAQRKGAALRAAEDYRRRHEN